MTKPVSVRSAWRFIFMLGFVSLFADMTYEGARGLSGPFLFSLGASATAVGFISGLGELVGYGLHYLFGALIQKSGKFWLFSIVGYTINLLSIPMLAFAATWPVAAVLLICERLGKSIRAPSKDTLLSHAASAVGHGKGFGFHEAMDQIGAVSGPLIGAAGLVYYGGYRGAFGLLAIPASLALLVLLGARFIFPNPARFEPEANALPSPTGKYPQQFWIYLVGAALLALGYADFPLVAYHMRKMGILTEVQAPIAYGVAMGVDAVAAVFFGMLFDRQGLKSLPWAAVMAGLAIPFAFSNSAIPCWIGIVLWGMALGAQESSLKAGIAKMISKDRRAMAYGTFHAAFGLSWFLGSVTMGWLYDWNKIGVLVLAMSAQVFSALAFAIAFRIGKRSEKK